jgi:hypothetical protein
MNAKVAAVVVGGLVISVAVADLLLGNTPQAILPDAVGNLLTQNVDIFLILASTAVIFLAVQYA